MKILDMHCDTISELLDIRRKGDAARIKAVSYTHLTLPTTPYV